MKHRLTSLAVIFICVILGLASRTWGDALPSFFAENAGDALWALMVYAGIAFLFPSKQPIHIAVLAFSFSATIECSQLIESTSFDVIRDTTLGRLVFGRGFLWVDFIRYAVGILIGFAGDYFLFRKPQTLSANH